VRKERVARLLASIDKLPREYRQIILWRSRDELTWPEIGRKVDRSPDAVRMFWKRAMARLKKILQDEDLDADFDGQ
jgi:DNA-directed RNA polymerase specialized sigma24 family protein